MPTPALAPSPELRLPGLFARTPRGVLALALGAALPLLAGCGAAAVPPSSRADVVPLRAVRMYETGVAYYERAGAVRSSSSLPVPAGHLDDALKSLVVLSPGGAAGVRSIAFASSTSPTLARSRAGLPDGSGPVSYRDLLASLKGESVSITTRARTVRGRVIDVVDEEAPATRGAEQVVHVSGTEHEKVERDGQEVERRERSSERHERVPSGVQAPGKVAWVVLLADEGELVRVRIDDVDGVRPTDPAAVRRLAMALDVLSPRSAQIERALGLLGDGQGEVTFGYVAESPVWRTTYRLVIPPEGASGRIQGWALVHNDTDEPWQGVRLELASGRPDSFLYPLAAPRYAHRPLVGPDEALSTIPQLQDQTVDALFGDGGVTGTGQGFGSGHGRLGGSHKSRAPSVRMGATSVGGPVVAESGLLEVGNLASLAKAEGFEAGALFLFRPEGPFSLAARSSALVPIVEKDVVVDELVFFESTSVEGRNAIRMANPTGQTLPAGTIAVFADGGFVGESQLARTKPGERRMLLVGTELDVEVKEVSASGVEDTKRVTVENDRLEEHFLRTTTRVLGLENRSGRRRTVALGVDAAKNAKVTGAERVEYDDEHDRPLAVLDVAPRDRATRTLTIVEGLSRRTYVSDLTDKVLRDLAQKPGVPPGEQAVLREAASHLAEAEATNRSVRAMRAEEKSAEADLERLQKHLTAAGAKDAGAQNPFVKRILDAEDRLAAAKKKEEALEKEAATKREKAKGVLKKLARPAP